MQRPISWFMLLTNQGIESTPYYILEDWYFNHDGFFKRLDHYWSNFSHWTLSGSPRYPLLFIAGKTCCSLQNQNADVEHSLSDNKNTLMKERASLGEETLKVLRLSKEFVRCNDGAHNLIESPEIGNPICDAYNPFKTRKTNKQLELLNLLLRRRKKRSYEKEGLKMLEKAETKKGKSEKKEESLAADPKLTNRSVQQKVFWKRVQCTHQKKNLLREICRKLKLLVLI